MSRFHLEATDGSGCFTLPNGATMIGRGPFLGVSDKRVSRNHAILEVVDNKLRIKPVHVNPCFYQTKEKSTFLPLEKDEWCWLCSGDCFSLLPDKYTFRVIADVEETLRNEALHEDIGLSDSLPCSSNASEIKEKPSPMRDTSKQSLLHPDQESHTEKEEIASTSAVYIEVAEKAGSTQRKRVLPDWMLREDLKIKSLLMPLNKPGTKKRNGAEQKMVMSNSDENPMGKKVLSKSEVAIDAEEECLKKKRKRSEGLPTKTSLKANIQMEDSDHNLKRPKLSDDDADDDMEVQNSEYVHNISKDAKKDQKKECENERYDIGAHSQSFKPTTSSNYKRADEDILGQSPVEDVSYSEADSPQAVSNKRTPCIYGESCYRKNPAHFQEFCHPGDSDYCDAENGSQDDKPECPYGTDCYRKNPQHKLEYKHTKPPERGGRRLRRRPAKKGKRVLDGDSDNNGEPNEYDLDDSFIDDDDEEDFDNTDEDSDWMPDSEDRDSEDVKTLLKEANKFVKGRH